MKREIRYLTTELRASDDGKKVEGYAAVYNVKSELLWGFRETIAPGAFADCLATNPDVRCLFNHDPSKILGRTKAGTLSLKEDDKGLWFSVDMPDTTVGKDLMKSIQRKDVSQCSFAFQAIDQRWDDIQDEKGEPQQFRTILKAELLDVSPVTYPAYPQTSCDVRTFWPEGLPDEVRVKQEEKECRCPCRACKSAECEECDTHIFDCKEATCRCKNGSRALEGRAKDGAKTKRVDSEDLTSDCFIIVGDPEKTETWKLPYKFSSEEKTKSHLRNALARFNQLKGVSADEKAKAWKKLVRLCKQYGIKVEGESDEKDSLEAWQEQARLRLKEAGIIAQ
jgi:hypothetical protein